MSLTLDDARERVGTCADVLGRHGIAHKIRRGGSPLAPRGVARCPLHPDGYRPRSWSLSLYRGSDGRSRWKCFGCGEGGDALDLEARLSGAANISEWLSREAACG